MSVNDFCGYSLSQSRLSDHTGLDKSDYTMLTQILHGYQQVRISTAL